MLLRQDGAADAGQSGTLSAEAVETTQVRHASA
jgi:hypothetical protein